MNKYTYIFQDLQLENQFQVQKMHDIRKPIFLCSAIGLFFISIIKMITELTQHNLNNLGVLIATQIILIISVIAVQLKPQTVQYCLILLNYLLLGYQYWMSSAVSQESQQLFANNFTICNLIIILMVDMIQAFVLILTTFLIKLILTMIADSSPQYNVYFATLLLIGFLGYCIKKLNFESRSFFLLSLKDNLWEKIIPIIVNKSFILCQFNQQQFSFSFIQSQKLDFECISTQQLKSFLREWTYKQQTLEEMFFKEIKQRQSLDVKQSQKTIQIFKEKKQMQITYCFFNYQHPTFLIKIENNLQVQEKLKTLICKTYGDRQEIQYKLLKSVVRNLSICLEGGNNNQLFILRLFCFKQLLNYKIINNQFIQKKIEIYSLLVLLRKMFSFKNVDFQLLQHEVNKIDTVKPYFLRLLYEIFNVSNCDTSIVINIENRNEIYIRYAGKNFDTNSDIVLSQVIHTLVKDYSKIEINQKQYRLMILHEEPNQPFRPDQFV